MYCLALWDVDVVIGIAACDHFIIR
jgi:hypothetical protein